MRGSAGRAREAPEHLLHVFDTSTSEGDSSSSQMGGQDRRILVWANQAPMRRENPPVGPDWTS